MNRIRATTMAVAMTLLTLAGCSGTGGDGGPDPATSSGDRPSPATSGGDRPSPATSGEDPSSPATAHQMVALLNFYGGFAGKRVKETDAPALAVFGDGLVVSDADRSLSLTETEVTDLVRTLREDLASQPATATPTGPSQVADARTMVLGVRVGDTMHTVTAYALDETRSDPSDPSYPEGLYQARDLLGALAERVSREGGSYTTDRVRLIAEPRPGQTGEEWPSSIPEPPASHEGDFEKILAGAKAADARRLIPRARQGGALRIYLDHQGRPFAVTWRYVLPSE